MSEILEAGGTMAMMVLVLGGIGAVVALALGGIAFMKRRVPLAFWVFVPVAVCVLGALGAWSSAGTVFGVLESVDAEAVNSAAMAGLWQSLTIDWFSRWVAAFVLVLCSFMCGLGSTISAGPVKETKLTPFAAGFAALTAVVGAIGLAMYGLGNGLALEAYLLAAVVLLGGLGVAFASARRALYEHGPRVAGLRFTSAACFVMAVVYGGRAVSMGTQIAMFGPNGTAVGADLPTAVVMWTDVADPIWTMAWVAFGLALLIAFFGFFSELGEVVQRFTLVDVWATLFLVAGLATVRVVEESRTNALAAVATHAPARAIFDAWGTDLPAAIVYVDKNPLEANVRHGGYGDVLVYQAFDMGTLDEDDKPIMKQEWRRTWVWDGSSWYADDSPLDCEGHAPGCTPPTINTARVPLMAIGKGESANLLLDAAKTLPGGEFMLLMRSTEAKAGDLVPHQLAHKQLGFLPVRVDAPVDLKEELWVDAGYKEMFWGPTAWYGEGEDKEPILYTDAIFADAVGEDGEAAKGVHVLVSPKARVEGIGGSCLAAQVNHDDGRAIPNDNWCSITEGEVEEWRAQAREVWELPDPETVRLRVAKIEAPDGVDVEHYEDVFRRETGAIAYCQELAHEKAFEDYDPEDKESELAPTHGRMEFSIVINDRGRINGTYVQDSSPLSNSDISRCAAKRYRKLAFDPLPKPEVVEGEPKPEPPIATLYLNYTFSKLPDPEE